MSAGPEAGLHLIISGRVQGVFFRKHTQRRGRELHLTGWVRNLPDGRVEATAFGPAAAVAQFEQWCRTTGSPKCRIDGVVSTAVELPPAGNGRPSSFDVRQ